MAKSKKVEETRTSIDDLNDSLTSLGAKVQENQKMVLVVTIVVALIVVGILIYLFLIRKPAVVNANTAIGAADYAQLVEGNDSTALVLYQEAAEKGYDAGNRAKLESAIILYRQGDYQQALDYLKGYKAKDDVVGAAAYSLKGDCYVNLDNLDEAVTAFKSAIKQSDNNPYYTPFFMLKLARVYAAQDKHAEEAAVYQDIIAKYPQYGQTNGINLEKYLERANLQAAK